MAKTEIDLLKLTNIDELNKAVLEGVEALTKYDSAFKDYVATVKSGAKSEKAGEEAQKQKKKTLTELQKIEAQRVATLKKIEVAQSQSNKELIKSKAELLAQNKAIRDNVKAQQEQEKALKVINKFEKEGSTIRGKTNKQIQEINRSYYLLFNTTARGTKENEKYRKATKSLNDQLEKTENSAGRAQRGVGKYAKSLANLGAQLLGSFGVIGGVTAFAGALLSAGNTVIDFDQAQADLASTSGKTREEIAELTEQAIDLGGSTEHTATSVTKLQTELTKLGFASSETKALTKDVLNLASATGAELADSAKVTGIAMRIYGEDMSQASRVTSALAVATTKSALSFADYETILSTVGPVANAFNFSLEDTLALTGKLKDAGFDASSAATATRNILLNLADTNGKLAKRLGGSVSSFEDLIPALQNLDKSGINLNETLQLTDKRSVSAFNTFLKQAGAANDLKASITDVTDELQKMVDTKTDSLQGDLTKLGSAWEGMVLRLEQGNGALAQSFRTIVQLASDFLNSVDYDAANENAKGAIARAEQMNAAGENGKSLLAEQSRQLELQILLNQQALQQEEEKIYSSAQLRRNLKEQNKEWQREKDLIDSAYDAMVKGEAEAAAAQQKRQEDEKARLEAALKADADRAAIAKKEAQENFEALNKIIEGEERKLELLESQLESQIEANVEKAFESEYVAGAEKAIRERYAAQQEALVESLQNQEISLNQFYQTQIENETALNRELLELAIERMENALELAEEAGENTAELELELFEARQELREEEQEEIVKSEEEKRAEYLKTLEVAQMVAEKGKEAIVKFGQAALNVKKGQIDTEIDYLRQKSQTDIGLTQEEEARQKELSRQKAEILRKEAILNKANALFEIGVNTAAAVAKALPVIPLSIAVGLLGAAQAAVVISQPLPTIPAFEKGTDNAPAGIKLVGEKGAEAMETKAGQLIGFTPATPTYINDMGGYRILNAQKTADKYRDSVNPYDRENNRLFRKMANNKPVVNIYNNGPARYGKRV